MQRLSAYLIHPQVKMIELSCKCLKSILSTESGAEAYEYLDNEAKNYLNPYKPSKSGSKNNSVKSSGIVFEKYYNNIFVGGPRTRFTF